MTKPTDDVVAWRRARRGRRRRRAAIYAGMMAALAIGVTVMFLPPRSPKPRPGAILPCGAVVVYSPGYRVSFGGIEHLHPFDTYKYDKIADRLVEDGVVPEDGFAVPQEASRERLIAVHDAAYVDSLQDASALGEALEIGLPGVIPNRLLDAYVVAPFRRAAGGTAVAAAAAREHGLGVNLGGGFHHARPDMGHGFCILNDVALAIHEQRQAGLTGPILIIDTDAHQGDGNHRFFADDASVVTFSIHEGSLFPIPKIPGDLDVELYAGTEDDEYLDQLALHLPALLDEHQPVMVFHVAGSDVLHDDPLTGLALTVDGLVRRDLLVTREVRSREIPLVHVLAGGYGPSSAEAQARSVAAILRDEWR